RRIIVGRVESGVLHEGGTLLFSPAGRIARVRTIERWNSPDEPEVSAGRVVGLTLDAPIFVERGDVASLPEQAPALTTEFRAQIVWLGDTPLVAGKSLLVKTATAETLVTVDAVERVFDLEVLQPIARDHVRQGEAATIHCRSRAMLALDSYADVPRMGRLVLVDGFLTVAAGLV